MADDLSAGGQSAGDAGRDDAPAAHAQPDERAEGARELHAEPPPPLSIRAKGQGPRGLNKPAIIALVGGATTLVLVLAASGLSSRPGGAANETRPLMSDPARPEMAQGRVRDLPRTYEEAATFARANGGAEDFPELGDPMAGDIAAFAPDMGAPGYNGADLGAPYGLDQNYAQSSVSPAGAQVSEVDTARRSGLFFQLRERGEQAAGAAPAREASVDAGESPDRDQMTSPHRLAAPISRRSLHPGAIIPASLITAINSEAPGPVVAQVTQGVHDSATGDRLLIPQGARLIGAYRSATAHGQRRITITWSRLIMPDGRQLVLDEAAVDAAGAAGVNGDVDNHWGEVFGAAALGTLINVGAAATEDRNSIGLSSGGFGVVAGEDPAEEAAREGVQRAASAVSGRVVERGLAVPPTIRINAGARISAIVTRELAL
jgi:type IV secretion system protein VirB10